jgi:primosomal protein N' (replication factor Y)
MIAKGLDFPNVTLVGVVSADTSLLLPDFRSAERTFQLIAQVAGRAGRGRDAGRVLVQTYNPDHFAIRRAVDGDYEGFAESELASRAELGYPPHGRLLRAVFSGEAESDAMRLAREAAAALEQADLPEGTAVLGPARAPLVRISGRFRWHLMVKAAGDAGVGAAGHALRPIARRLAAVRTARSRPGACGTGGEGAAPGAAPRMQLDVDPLSML